jgi:hypothetical protein
MHHHWISQGIGYGAAGMWVLSSAVTTMPPYTGSNYGMKWLYAFLHLLAANLDKVHIPGSAGDKTAQP